MCAMKYPTWEEFMGDWEEFIKGSFGDRPMFPTLAPETPTFMGLPEAKTPEDLKGVDAAIIGAPYVATTHDTYAGVDRMSGSRHRRGSGSSRRDTSRGISRSSAWTCSTT